MIGLAALLFLQTSATVNAGGKGTTLTVISHGRDEMPSKDSSTRKAPIPITPELVASAFLDEGSRSLVSRARDARKGQDSSLVSYSANTLQRMTLGLGLSRFGRDRMLFRYESAARVDWQRGKGAQVEITGRRAVAPAIAKNVRVEIDSWVSPIPYFPGREALWTGSAMVKDEIDAEDIVHPLASGAEAYYTYQSGDSVSFRLGDGTTIQLREVLVRPRKVQWNAVVGSLWFDVGSGQLVRGAYKFSEPMDLWKDDPDDDTPALVRAMIDPATVEISGMAIEYGLHNGRYWLPRTQSFSGKATFGFMTLPAELQETFSYNGVNADDIVVQLPPPRVRMDTSSLEGLTGAQRDSARARLRHKRDSTESAVAKQQCAEQGYREERVRRYDGALAVGVKVPCDNVKLATSSTLPASIYDDDSPLFNDAERDALLKRAENLLAVPQLTFYRPPDIKWSWRQLRFNRVEGISSSVIAEQFLGRDLYLRATPRIGTADRVFNYDLSLLKKRPSADLAVTGYKRLVADTYWGDPLSFGSSLTGALFGRDEGVYYRARGAEVSGVWYKAVRTFWSVYAQHESDAVARNTRSLPQLLGGDGFSPAANILADDANEFGGSLRMVGQLGRDPSKLRLLSDLRVDGAGGDSEYGRASVDFTLMQGLFGPYGASLQLGAGTSIGDVPIQHLYYLGGTSTVRGQSIGANAGNAYWLTRFELGKGLAARRVVFADFGWAGDREFVSEVGRPMSGVGIGLSFLDGLMRFDMARGLYPEKQFRFSLYMDSKF